MNYRDHEELVTEVTQALSALARAALVSLEQARNYPGFSAETNDLNIEHYGKRAKELRRIREEFEDLMAEQVGAQV